MFQRLFAKKSLEMLHAEMEGDNRLRRILGPVGLTSLGVGAIIGAGIFVMTGRVAATDAGPAIILSYVLAGFACTLAAFCYAEFASLAPVAGSAYTYAYATLGELLAWMIGWDLILEYAMSAAVVGAAWTHYFNELLKNLGIAQVPWYLSSDPFSKPGAWFNLPAMFILGAVTWVLVIGIKESAASNTAMVFVKLGVILFVIVIGVPFINPSNYTEIPFADQVRPEGRASWGMLAHVGIDKALESWDESTRSNFMPFGISGVILGASLVFFAFLGFDSVSTHAEEAIKPQRDVPIAILASLVICTVLYIGVAAVITGMVPYPQIDTKAALASAFSELHEKGEGGFALRISAGMIALGGLAGMTSVLLITFLSQARIFLAMARDGLMPQSIFGKVHEKYKTPHISTILTGVAMMVVAGFTPIEALEEMVNIGTFFAFIVVAAAVMILRVRRPDAPRPFRCPALFVVAPLCILVNLVMMMFLAPITWLRLAIWLALGLAVYFAYGYWNSALARER